MAGDDAAGPRVGRPAQLSRDRILDAVATFDNVDALTMRELAARLDVRHGALYRWVSSRDELFDLISEAMVDRILATPPATSPDWRVSLVHLATMMRREFLALPGYASYLARPHRHNDRAVSRLRETSIAVFEQAGSSLELAQQSWLIFITTTVGWLAAEEQPDISPGIDRRFELFLGVLLRGLPADDLSFPAAAPDRSSVNERNLPQSRR